MFVGIISQSLDETKAEVGPIVLFAFGPRKFNLEANLLLCLGYRRKHFSLQRLFFLPQNVSSLDGKI